MPDKKKGCEVCGQFPVISETGMCGPCTFGTVAGTGEGELSDGGPMPDKKGVNFCSKHQRPHMERRHKSCVYQNDKKRLDSAEEFYRKIQVGKGSWVEKIKARDAAVRAEERERCCRDVCPACGESEIYGRAEFDGFGWHHPTVQLPVTFLVCKASKIRRSGRKGNG